MPKNWNSKTLGEVCSVVTDGTHKTPTYVDKGVPFISIANIQPFLPISFKRYEKYITPAEHEVLIRRAKPEKDDILFPRIGTLGYAKRVDWDFDFSIFVGLGLAKPIRDIVRPKFLEYYMNTSFVSDFSTRNANGSGRLTLPLEASRLMPIPLPPIEEQERIVAKIEEVFSELDAGVESLKKAKAQLKTYRQAVLKHAFEGKLTNENVPDGELPSGWKWKEIAEISSVLGDGLHGTPKYSEDGEYYFINGNNLQDGRIEFKENTKNVSEEEFKKYKKPLNDKTILVSINGTLGKTAFFNNERVVLGKSACYFNVADEIDKRFVRYSLTTNRFLNYANKVATGSTIKNVGLKAMREFEVPIPSTLDEQRQIVEEIESRLSVCDKLEETIAASLKQSEALRQSILKQAFEGKLVQ